MARPTVQRSSDWLRPTRPLIRQVEARPDLLPLITTLNDRELHWTTMFGAILGAIFGLSIVLAIAS
ncbi:MAG: hypothetical protein PGN16_03930 [Sphingomonas phyllosphaerae]|uniref:hypothetical protein n=1 Tax=Sphingomonas phyllosphaerae TaxID=257003 RepID=UPI002FFD08A6